MKNTSDVGYDFYQRMHEKNLPAIQSLLNRIARGILQVIDIRVDQSDFGHTRITILIHDIEE